tara:strand:+ start:196 stop:651 length:456 start_codon:yes stop_codon:yes gene_type:complete
MYSFKLVDTLIDYPPFRSNMSQARDDNKPDDERPQEEIKNLVEIFLKEVPQYQPARTQEIDIDTLSMSIERRTIETAMIGIEEMMENGGDVEEAAEYAGWETEDYEIVEEGNWVSSHYISRGQYNQIWDKLKQAENYLNVMLERMTEGEKE